MYIFNILSVSYRDLHKQNEFFFLYLLVTKVDDVLKLHFVLTHLIFIFFLSHADGSVKFWDASASKFLKFTFT